MKMKLSLFLVVLFLLPAFCSGAQVWKKPDGTVISAPNVDSSGNLTITDGLYAGKTSTTMVGRLTATSTVNIGYAVTELSILTKGLESSTTSNYWAGTLYIPDGINSTILFDVPISTNFTFTSTLGASTTVYYMIRGAK